MGELVFRFVAGGIVVSLFAVMAEICRPKSFSGLFSAAPSIALATLGITIAHHGKAYAAAEARSMIWGACGFFCYAALASYLLMRLKPSAMLATLALLPVWLGASLALWFFLGR